MPLKKIKIFIFWKSYENLRSLKGRFQVENKVTSMYKISCLHPTRFLNKNEIEFKY
jgi:hypothetical protein